MVAKFRTQKKKHSVKEEIHSGMIAFRIISAGYIFDGYCKCDMYLLPSSNWTQFLEIKLLMENNGSQVISVYCQQSQQNQEKPKQKELMNAFS